MNDLYMYFLSKKIYKKNFSCIFPILVIKTLDPDPDPDPVEMLDTVPDSLLRMLPQWRVA